MTTTTNSRYVTRQPDILSGEPIIKGTRTPVRVDECEQLIKIIAKSIVTTKAKLGK